MRYLNRVFLINSAQVKYAEISLDGNIHFIGTQGVGKSTLLRAILFFYNADTLKLGIPKTKKSFLDYYFPYSNSYIIYEVARTSGEYCVLAYKSSGKVCFRFIDGRYAQEYFLNADNRAYESWGAIVRQLDASGIHYTKKKIDSYQEYRDTLYGNNSGKARELRRYALIESKDYQNIPRTIQNVFLNSELKAEFIKDTIIKSLGNDIQIDLSNYTHHLKGFELQLTEIKRFRDVKTMSQANAISKLCIAIKYLNAEKAQLAKSLAGAISEILVREPELSKNLTVERASEKRLEVKLKRTNELFVSKEKRINDEISVLKSHLKDAKSKAIEYEEMKIQTIIDRVSKRPTLDKESRHLSDEKTLLTAQFKELTQKYQALEKELENQLIEFVNLKDQERLTVQSRFQDFKSSTTDDFEKLFSKIRIEHGAQVADARAELDDKKEGTNKLNIQREQIKQQRFHEAEIESSQNYLEQLDDNTKGSGFAIERLTGQVEVMQKQWMIGEERLRETEARDRERIEEKSSNTLIRIQEFDRYIQASEASLYGWLVKNCPGWENTIGKVIDEKNVLFSSDLSPEMVDKSDTTFFGVKLDLDEIDKEVKSVTDYERERKLHIEKVENFKKSTQQLSGKLITDIDNLKKKYQSKIKDFKDRIREHEYLLEQSVVKHAEATLELQDLRARAQEEKKDAIIAIDASIAKSIEGEIGAKENVDKIESILSKYINNKKKDRNLKIAEGKRTLEEKVRKVELEVAVKMDEHKKRKEYMRSRQQSELEYKGADTIRLKEIEQRLEVIKVDLEYIESSRDIVAEYKKDKRELFDRVADFKSEKKGLESELIQEKHKSDLQKQNIDDDLTTVQSAIQFLVKRLEEIEEDKEKFETFRQSKCYSSVHEHFQSEDDALKAEKRVVRLIDEINDIHYERLSSRIEELRKTVTVFLGKFSEDNIFKFKKHGDDVSAYLQFAEDLLDYIEQDKVSVLEKEVNERFVFIIQTIGKETTDLVSKEGEIQNVITKINRDFVERNFAGVIKKIELMLDQSKSEVVQLLKAIKAFNDENALELGRANLFSTDNSDAGNKKAVDLLKQFVKKIGEMRKDEISLSDSFELKFRIEENENDTGWVEKLSNVGSEGTDVLVKAMVNIMLLNVFKEGASKRFRDFQLHCMMDEIGKLHPNNVRGILKFANDRNIFLINSSPTENDALAFKHIYKLEKDKDSITKVKRIVTQFSHS